MSEGAPGRDLPPGLYRYGAVRPGDRIRTGTATVSAAAIDAFADLTGDRFVIHMDEAAARARGFDGRVAHGLLVLSLVDGLKNRTPAQFDAIASLGWNWTFAAPVIAGDTIGATITVAAKRPVSRPDRGILTLDFSVTAQDGREVQRGTNLLMVAC